MSSVRSGTAQRSSSSPCSPAGRGNATKNKDKVAVAYARVSTKANQEKGGVDRQVRACQAAAAGRGARIAKTVAEVVSGSLPLAARTTFMQLLEDENVDTVYCESARAVARDALVAEQIFEEARARNVKIVTADMPGVFEANAGPMEKFLRRTIFTYTELEKDLTVHRLKAGLARRLKNSSERTQQGKPKANGRPTTLDALPSLSAATVRKVRAEFDRRDQGDIGWRPLATRLARILRLPSTPSHETARRMRADFKRKFGAQWGR